MTTNGAAKDTSLEISPLSSSLGFINFVSILYKDQIYKLIFL